jgi:hypothetical protein
MIKMWRQKIKFFLLITFLLSLFADSASGAMGRKGMRTRHRGTGGLDDITLVM